MSDEAQAELSIEERVARKVAPELFVEKPADEVVEEPEEIAEAGENAVVEGDDAPEVKAEPEIVYEEMEINGNVYQVPPELKEGFLSQAAFTQKSQTLANDRKELEVQQGNVKSVQEQYKFLNDAQEDISAIQQANFTLKQYEDYLSLNAKDLDAQTITLTQLEIRKLEKDRDARMDGLKYKQGEFQQAQEQSRKELLDKSTEILKGKIPEWNEEKDTEVRSFAKETYGYTDVQMGMASHQDLQVLHDALLFRNIQKGLQGAVKQVEAAPTIQPKARQTMPDEVKAKLAFRKQIKDPKKSSREKARLIEKRMGERFG